ncbi:hypothetical protein K501DRAFT_333963 [Backusella circina FSU 941]|nr:hypothetical protein K501DRAFT_333963 [Backusella circina FSU 941]
MSINSRYRERKYNSSENDRLLRALSQPVQAWDKKWTSHADTKKLAIYKWVKSERTIHYEPDEESEDEPVEMDQDKEPLDQDTTETPTSEQKTDSFSAIPGGHSSLLQSSAMNKTVSTLQMEDDERSHTPNLDDISDVESDRNLDDDNDNDVDSVSDPSKHPALAPHAQAHMTDDDMMTDSSVATPADERADQVMEEAIQHPHPLSQEPIIAEPSNEFASSSTITPLVPIGEPAQLAPPLSAATSSSLQELTQETSAPEMSIQEKEPVMEDDPMQEDPIQVEQQQEEGNEDKPSSEVGQQNMVLEEKEKEVKDQEEDAPLDPAIEDASDSIKPAEAALEEVPETQDNLHEPTKVIIQEPTQESTQEIILEPTQQSPQEPAPEPVPEPVPEPTQDIVEAPQEEAPQEEAPQEEAPQEEAPQEEAPQEEAPQEEAPQEETTQEEAPQEEAPQDEVVHEKTEETVQEATKETSSEVTPVVDIPTFDATSPKDVAAIADANTTVGLPANIEATSMEEKPEPVAVVTDEQQFEPMEH